MKLATWNVNSLRVRLPHVCDWLARVQPDVLCLQETKVTDEECPVESLREAGYHVLHSGQKSYNGVAILSRAPLGEASTEAPGLDGGQKRYVAATVSGVRVISVYVPNGEAVTSPKYAYKLEWLAALRAHLVQELKRFPLLAVVGDFNVAPEERDVHDPRLWQNQVLFSAPERAALRALMDVGLVDVFRKFVQPAGSFSWWDYRKGAFRRNLGLRIDHIFCSAPLAERCGACTIDTAPRALERPSDHAPVIAEFGSLEE
ncbi:MAG: exodeoxyribonuclease III [Gammaproteobacteria bacterium]